MQGSRAVPIKGKAKKTKVSNVVRLDAVNPIPFEYGGSTFSFVHSVSYLPFLPPKDNYGQMLLEARLLSATHDACVRTKKDYCAGQGFHDVDGKEFSEDIKTWFRSMNLRNESATKINKKIFEDKFTWGNVPIEVVRFTVAGKKKFFVYPHNFLEWRLGKPNADGVCDYAIQSKLLHQA